MAQDGLLFKVFARVNEKTQVPLITIGVCGLFSAFVALFFDIEKLVEFMSIGTLMAYTIVSAAVIILRYRPLVVRSDVLPLTESPVSPGSAKDFVNVWKLNELLGQMGITFYLCCRC
jgi:cationic amino acid transporter 4